MVKMIELKVLRMDHAKGLKIPAYQSAGAAGADVRAAVEAVISVKPGERVAVPTGLILEMPEGFEVQVRPRSGLAFKYGLTVVNAPGTIDSDYRGEVKILLVNLGHEDVTITRGDRIAQLVVAPVSRVLFVEEQDLTSTGRGDGGFGSTGV